MADETRLARWRPWAGALLGLAWFIALGGGPALDPTHLDWLGWGDWTKSVLGWWFFRDAPWSFPLGRTPDLMPPLLTTVGFTDSNPWVSVLLKPFTRVLPRDFQFIGIWLAACLALQGFMGVKLMSVITPRASHQMIGAAFFVLAPVLVFRFGHDALCAHWMVTALLWLHLRPCPDAHSAWRTLRIALLLNVLAAGTHPYLAVMVFALSTALLIGMVWPTRRLGWRQVGLAFLGGSLAVGAVFLLFGYVGQGVSGATSGFGVYSADMLSLFNPMGWSRILPWLPAQEGQYEGFGYLGTGVLVLALAALLGRPSVWWREACTRVRAHAPLMGIVMLLALFAFSTTMTLGGVTVLTMRKLAAPLMPVVGMFRASGRFIWPLHYVVLTGILALAVWRWRQRPALVTGVLVGALLLQVVDTADLWTQQRFRSAPWPRLVAPEWEQLDPDYRHVIMFPPYIHGSQVPCVESTFAQYDSVRWGDLAYRKGLTTNSGYAARFNDRQVQEVCAALTTNIEKGQFAPDTVYVVDPTRLALFERQGERVTCGTLDGFKVCVASTGGRFQEALLKTTVRAPAPPTADSPP